MQPASSLCSPSWWKLLLGANNEDDNGKTGLMLASSSGQWEIGRAPATLLRRFVCVCVWETQATTGLGNLVKCQKMAEGARRTRVLQRRPLLVLVMGSWTHESVPANQLVTYDPVGRA